MRISFILSVLLAVGCNGQPSEEPIDTAVKALDVCINGPGFPSCYGECGHLTCGDGYPDLCCACDDGCEARGDCCCDKPIYCPKIPTCEGSCGGQSPDGCFCDTDCVGFGDCCGDFATKCDKAMDLDVGGRHVCARTETGRVRCFGANDVGQLGYAHVQDIGDNEHPSSAGDVSLGSLAKRISIGSDHSCVLVANTGQVRCWGSNAGGQLGLGNTTPIGDNEPPSSGGFVALGGVATQISAGVGNHTCARLTTGAVRCWGVNNSGELGYGHTSPIGDNEAPSSAGNVSVGFSVASVVTGQGHTCALSTTGAVRCWGWNPSGQLGYGHTNNIGDNELPSSAGNVNIGGAVKQIVAGTNHTCALLTTGAVKCWGMGETGALGYGNTSRIGDNETPASVGNVSIGGIATELAAGGNHTCALLTTGGVRCWGVNQLGELGLGHTNRIGDNELPSSAPLVSLGGPAVKIAAGGYETCALLQSGAIRCWGRNPDGQLGLASVTPIGDTELPTAVPPASVF